MPYEIQPGDRRSLQWVVIRVAPHAFLTRSSTGGTTSAMSTSIATTMTGTTATGSRAVRNFLPTNQQQPVYGLLFCFVSCPFHPPSILPISSSGRESAAYFFVSSAFDSQSTMSRTFRVSSLRMASRTEGILSPRGKKLAVAIDSIISTKSASIFPPSEWRTVFGRIW